MPNTVPTVTQGVTVYSFLVAKCEFKGCGTVSAAVLKSSKLSKAHTVGRIQGNIQEQDVLEEQEKMWKSLRYILDRMEVRLKGSKSFFDWIHTSPRQTWLFCDDQIHLGYGHLAAFWWFLRLPFLLFISIHKLHLPASINLHMLLGMVWFFLFPREEEGCSN